MRYEIVLSPEAIEDLKGFHARDRAELKDAMEAHLRSEPTKTSRSRIKRLRGSARPGFRLRVGDFRVFYDVTENEGQVLAVVLKSEAGSWLERAVSRD
jgi:mRNA-degrading endonuclease RelE of RelBE toxin-antitoxin system